MKGMLLVYDEGDYSQYTKAIRQGSGLPYVWKHSEVLDLANLPRVSLVLGDKLCKRYFKESAKSFLKGIININGSVIVPVDTNLRPHEIAERFLLASEIYDNENFDPNFTSVDIVAEEAAVDTFKSLDGKTIAFDYETNSVDVHISDFRVTILSITYVAGHSIVFQNPSKALIQSFYDLVLNNPNIHKIAQNLKYDLKVTMRVLGVDSFRGKFSDTMLMSFAVDERSPNGLKHMVRHYFPMWGGYDVGITYTDADSIEDLTDYGARDTDATFRLYYILHNQMDIDELRVFRNIDMPGVFALLGCEYRGAKMSKVLLEEWIPKLEKAIKNREAELLRYPQIHKFIQAKNKALLKADIKKIQDKIDAKVEKLGVDAENNTHVKRWRAQLAEMKVNKPVYYEEVNFNSPAQLGDLLWTEDGFNFKHPKGLKSTDRKYLLDIDHGFMHSFLGYRTMTGLLGKYYTGLLEKLDDNNYIHGSFNQTTAKTHRLSSSNPNLQNMISRIPFKDEECKEFVKMVKQFFVAPEGCYTVQADFSQAELRMIANFSGDENMIGAYLGGIDLHAKTASQIVDMTLEEFMELPKEEYKAKRQYGKPANFGWVYKSSLDGYMDFAKNSYGIVVSKKEAQKHKDAIFKSYPKLNNWHKTFVTYGKKCKFVKTLFGSKRRLTHIDNKSDSYQQGKAERIAINSPIQGSSGQWTVYVMGLLEYRLDPRVKMWSTVHDSIMFYIPKDIWTETKEIITETCENPPLKYFKLTHKMQVPMKIDFELSDESWGQMEEII